MPSPRVVKLGGLLLWVLGLAVLNGLIAAQGTGQVVRATVAAG